MTREGALLVILGVVVVLIGLGVLAWRRRTRRDSGLIAPTGVVPAEAQDVLTLSGFYVATTRHDDPLERLAIAGLAFRSRVEVTVTDLGVGLALTGSEPVFLATSRLLSVDLARVAIDRVVEPGGLVRLSWEAERTDGGTEPVDTYLRPQDASARLLADAISGTLPPAADAAPGTTPTVTPTPTTTTPTGTDA